MAITLNDLTVSPQGLDRESLLSDWEWAMDEPMLPVLLTAMGDVFAQSESGAVYFISVVDGTITKVGDDGETFQALLRDQEFVTDFLMPGQIVALRDAGMTLEGTEVYSHKHPLVLGGEDALENYEKADVAVHVSIHGQIHRQIKDLPPGTPIDNIVVE